MTLTDEEIDNIWRATEGHWNFARAIEARVHEELRKHEPFGNLFPHNGLYNGFCISAPIESLKDAPYGMKLYAAPLPPTDEIDNLRGFVRALAHDFDCCADEADSSDSTLAERLRKCRDHALSEVQAAPIPPEPTPATKGGITACPHGVPHCWPCEICDVVPITTPSQQDALDALDNMDDYARMVGLIAIGPIETLRDFILSRPDTEGSGK